MTDTNLEEPTDDDASADELSLEWLDRLHLPWARSISAYLLSVGVTLLGFWISAKLFGGLHMGRSWSYLAASAVFALPGPAFARTLASERFKRWFRKNTGVGFLGLSASMLLIASVVPLLLIATWLVPDFEIHGFWTLLGIAGVLIAVDTVTSPLVDRIINFVSPPVTEGP